MTAEPVPNMPTVDLTDDMLFRIETGETVTYGELKRRLAAAPAVQPASGRTLGQVAYEGCAQGLPGCEWSNQTATQKRAWEKAAQAVAALAHPLAQGSESGPTCQRCGGEIHGWCCQSCDAEFRENDAGNLVFDEDAALSQPGPASEGEAR